MALTALIFTHDDRIVRILKLLLADIAIQAEHVVDFTKAQNALWTRKYDAFFAECEDPQGAALLKSIRKSKHNQRSIAFALSDSAVKVSVAFDLGAHFVVQKPLVVEKVKRTLKAAHGLMMREQRAQFRHAAFGQATLKLESGAVKQASLRDLTQSGAMIESNSPLRKGQNLDIRFVLPETSTSIESGATVSWSDPTGRAGLRFQVMQEASRHALLEWVISRSMEPDEPVAEAPAPAKHAPAPEEVPLDLEVEVIEPVEEDSRLRATLRGQHQAPMKVLGFSGGRPVIVTGTCCNLSELGFAADLDEELGADKLVLVSINLPDTSDSMVVHAEVRYSEGRRYGFEFVALSETRREVLRTCVLDLPVE